MSCESGTPMNGWSYGRRLPLRQALSYTYTDVCPILFRVTRFLLSAITRASPAPTYNLYAFTSMRLTLSTMPEELLERILAFAVTPALPQRSSPSLKKLGVAPHVAPLLVSRTWLRIATPTFYRHITLRSDKQTALLAQSLRRNPELGRWVRGIRAEGTYSRLLDVIQYCPALEEFDMTVDNGPSNLQMAHLSSQRPPAVDAAVVRFCNSFSYMRRLRHLVIRKNAYLTLPGPTHVFEQLGKAIRGWKYLVSTIVALVNFNRCPLFAFVAPARHNGIVCVGITSVFAIPSDRQLARAPIWTSTPTSLRPLICSIHSC